MTKRVAIGKAGAAAFALALAAGAAQAQSYPISANGPGSPGYNYDPCRRDANQRGTAGALIGGGMGAVIGSNAAARNARTEGALLGGLLGAIAGGVVGN
ncbi:MAG: glycine zipper 2TM domain-containing protein, partial [Phenylobacterium sp.]|nr:glycine zipper 2TM domain-containing protein [Phenylobacterium sp.]